MKLAEWLDTPNPDGSRKERGKFAARIGVTPQMISAYCKGTFPKPERLREIVKHTDGAVTPDDFLQNEAAQ